MSDNYVMAIQARLNSRAWIVGNHGYLWDGQAPTINLDGTWFTAPAHYPDGCLLPGIVLGKKTATGLFGPYDPAANDGRQTAKGFLLDPTPVEYGFTIERSRILLAGFIDPAQLPATSGLDAAARESLRNFVFLDLA
ncbi:head decoration protein [Nocardia sp. NPDC059246]|uniref:head decoration protein n=1 Tax=unclassified Nocardia TaxID=2637762 RepID=UPI0036760814